MKYFKFLILLIFFGCEKQALVTYNVKNLSSYPIKVVFYNENAYDSSHNKEDSIIVEVGVEKKVVIQSKGLSRVSNYKESEDNLRDFQYVKIYQNNVLSSVNFLKSNEWTYSEQNSHNATYTCEVNQTDF